MFVRAVVAPSTWRGMALRGQLRTVSQFPDGRLSCNAPQTLAEKDSVSGVQVSHCCPLECCSKKVFRFLSFRDTLEPLQLVLPLL